MFASLLHVEVREVLPLSGNCGFQNLPSEDGTYAVAIVAGDATSLVHTNNLLLNGQPLIDPGPYDPNATPGYAKGDFDGWAQDVTVTDGFITITAGAGALDPTLCFIEVGPKDSHVDQVAQDRLAKAVTDATNRTGGPPFHKNLNEVRTYVYGGDYIDAPLMMRVASGTVSKDYYLHANSLYSVQAVTDSNGHVVEQYSYDAYGRRMIVGSTSETSAIGLTVGFTGLRHEGDLLFARNRYMSTSLGRWISRDPKGYVDGRNLYRSYFMPNSVDPMGTQDADQSITTPAGIPVPSSDVALNINGLGQKQNYLESDLKDEYGNLVPEKDRIAWLINATAASTIESLHKTIVSTLLHIREVKGDAVKIRINIRTHGVAGELHFNSESAILTNGNATDLFSNIGPQVNFIDINACTRGMDFDPAMKLLADNARKKLLDSIAQVSGNTLTRGTIGPASDGPVKIMPGEDQGTYTTDGKGLSYFKPTQTFP